MWEDTRPSRGNPCDDKENVKTPYRQYRSLELKPGLTAASAVLPAEPLFHPNIPSKRRNARDLFEVNIDGHQDLAQYFFSRTISSNYHNTNNYLHFNFNFQPKVQLLFLWPKELVLNSQSQISPLDCPFQDNGSDLQIQKEDNALHAREHLCLANICTR